MASSDDASRVRLSLAAEIARLEALLARMLDVEARTRRPHHCRVCQLQTKEDE